MAGALVPPADDPTGCVVMAPGFGPITAVSVGVAAGEVVISVKTTISVG
jgi:hypothetical protein